MIALAESQVFEVEQQEIRRTVMYQNVTYDERGKVVPMMV